MSLSKKQLRYNWRARTELPQAPKSKKKQKKQPSSEDTEDEVRAAKRARLVVAEGAEAAGSADPNAAVLDPSLETALTARNEYAEDAAAFPREKQLKTKRKGLPDLDNMRHPRQLSNKQVRRLQQIVARREKKARHGELLEQLKEHQLSEEQMQLLQRTATLAQGRKTTKQLLRQMLKEERAGIDVTAAALPATSKVKLHIEKPAATAEAAASSSSSDSSSSDEDEEEADAEAETEAAKTKAAAEAEAAKASAAKTVVLPQKPHKPSAAELMARPRVKPSAPAIAVPVQRTPEIQARRLQLPIIREEHTIMEAINQNDVIILCGETGSGKTTQVPQFLYEAGFTRRLGEHNQRMLIGVTEPRRIAARSMAERVGQEMSLGPHIVSYQVRYEGTTSDSTEIKFMTDGVLQKEIEADFALKKYSAIIVDEAHERSMHTDILLGLLSRIVPLRKKMAGQKAQDGSSLPCLKLIIMSATLRVEDFTSNKNLFPRLTIPVISVDARQFPVATHFAKRTKVDIDSVAEALRKVSQIHERLPSGGILVFLTGQAEIHDLCKKLKKRYPVRREREEAARAAAAAEQEQDPLAEFDGELSEDEASDENSGSDESSDGEGEKSIAAEDEAAAEELKTYEEEASTSYAPLHVLPLYSNLSHSKQTAVFEDPPPGHRKCIVATNVAETSITIPGIRYVVDGGQVKSLHYDKTTGVSSFVVEWTSKASADQRAGRAGRTGPGHCYRLFSSAVYNDEFEQFSEPEILRLPADGLTLQMKAMSIDKVANFPFPTPPEAAALASAEKLLVRLNALDKFDKKITPLGRTMARFPVAPRYAKMLALAAHYDCSPHIQAIVAALTVKNLFNQTNIDDLDDDEEDDDMSGKTSAAKERRSALHRALQQWKLAGISGGGDMAALLHAIGASDFEAQRRPAELEAFAERMGLRYKAIVEINKLRKQLASTDTTFGGWEDEQESAVDSKPKRVPPLQPPTPDQLDAIRQIILAGFGDCVARLESNTDGAYACDAVETPVYIHPRSSLYGQRPIYVVYHELAKGKTKVYMKGVTLVQVEWLPRLVPFLCTFSKPLENPAPYYDDKRDEIRCVMSATFGRHRWAIPPVEVPYPSCPDRFRYFARFVLEGKVFPLLAQYTPKMKNKPSILNKPWSKERVVAILQPLVDNQIDSKAKLAAKWKTDERFLVEPISLWLDREDFNELMTKWPPSSA
eukprot:m.114735 g.114735  ORF g.114735 m.114735 type:complete len:1207 (-) comp9458_c0_seq1:121-3741(-)